MKHDAVISASQAARILTLSESTLAKLRLSGKGPAYCKLGRRVVYREQDLNTWLDAHRRLSTSDSGEDLC
jgi:predicted DNA-binding transcriptional regulator AlpA